MDRAVRMRLAFGLNFDIRDVTMLEPELTLPLDLVPEDRVAVHLHRTSRDPFSNTRMLATAPVDPLTLRLVDHQFVTDAHGLPLKAIDAPEAARLMLIAGDTAAAIAFLCGVPVHVSSLIQDDELVAESEADRSALDALGTSWVYREHLVGGEIRAFGARNVDSQIVRALLPRRAGLRLYADALAAQTPVARYRELWRVLESAFGLRGPELVAALGDYEPVRQLEFDARELEALLVLRGRASHAASGAGFDEVLQVTEDILTHVERLSSLAERVIATKRTWGLKGLGVEDVLPLADFLGSEPRTHTEMPERNMEPGAGRAG